MIQTEEIQESSNWVEMEGGGKMDIVNMYIYTTKLFRKREQIHNPFIFLNIKDMTTIYENFCSPIIPLIPSFGSPKF